jgi:hypothetical protein
LFTQVFAQAIDHRERQVAMGDRRPERALALRTLGVDVDPLIIAAQLGEPIDHLLGHLPPRARPYHLILERLDVLDPVGDGLGHARANSHFASLFADVC